MKRKLINYDVFESIQNSAVSNAENELAEAGEMLTKALNVESLKLSCFGPDTVMYETHSGPFIHANYKITNKEVVFENIEQLIVDAGSEQAKLKSVVSDLIESLVDDNTSTADSMFEAYINSRSYKRTISESAKVKKDKKKDKKTGKKKLVSPDLKEKIKGLKNVEDGKDSGKKDKNKKEFLFFKKAKSKASKLKEWTMIAENVEEFANYKQFGTFAKENILSVDSKGNVTSVSVPNLKTKNEAKLLSADWKTLDTDVKVLRKSAKKLAENSAFCKAVAQIKRWNALSDSDKIQESLEDLTSRFSSVLYLTQDELSSIISEALEAVGASNYEDTTCDFLAEAILVTAHANYSERVNKVLTLAGSKVDESSEDSYANFKQVTDSFYPKLDESASREMQVYVDLYESLRTVYEIAQASNNQFLKSETSNHLNDLMSILEQNMEPNIQVAISAAEWLTHLVETNLEAEGWDVSNNVHVTISGDHPRMAKNSQKSYTPSSDFSGNWQSAAPVSDGNGIKKNLADDMEGDSWSNIGGEDTYPSLNNPYLLKPYGDYKMKGEKDVDSDSGQLAHAGGEDTWPNLKNPYLLNSPDVFKMKSDDLVVDK
jgi:hypothetical protein